MLQEINIKETNFPHCRIWRGGHGFKENWRLNHNQSWILMKNMQKMGQFIQGGESCTMINAPLEFKIEFPCIVIWNQRSIEYAVAPNIEYLFQELKCAKKMDFVITGYWIKRLSMLLWIAMHWDSKPSEHRIVKRNLNCHLLLFSLFIVL